MLLLTGTVADFVDTILSQATQATQATKGMDIDDMCSRAESMANEIVETIVIGDSGETIPADPKATNTYPPSSL